MPFRLHKAPAGLLELFRLRTLGSNPPQFGDAVTPVCDVTEFYGVDLVSNVSEAGAAGAIGASLTSAASANPRRYVGFSGHILLGAVAGTTLTLGLAYRYQGVSVGLAFANILAPVAASLYRIAVPNMRGLVLPAGHLLEFQVSGNATGTDHTPSIRYGFQVLDGR